MKNLEQIKSELAKRRIKDGHHVDDWIVSTMCERKGWQVEESHVIEHQHVSTQPFDSEEHAIYKSLSDKLQSIEAIQHHIQPTSCFQGVTNGYLHTTYRSPDRAPRQEALGTFVVQTVLHSHALVK